MNKVSWFLLGVYLGIYLVFIFLAARPASYDLNNDGTVDIKDMLIIQKYIIEQEEEKED